MLCVVSAPEEIDAEHHHELVDLVRLVDLVLQQRAAVTHAEMRQDLAVMARLPLL